MITIIAHGGYGGHQLQHADALSMGLKRHGIPTRITGNYKASPGETVACWGWRMGERLRRDGADVLVLERGYIGDRFAYTSLAWNGLNNLGTLPAVDDGGQRFRQLWADQLQPANPAGVYTLIVGQVPGDASLRGRDLHPWYCEQAAKAKAAGDLVFFRPHPLAHKRAAVRDVPAAPTMRGDLGATLRDARLVLTYNSNTGVDALLAGKHVSVEDAGGMAYGVSLADREPWAHRLAWRQFSLDEIRSGLAWEVARGSTHS